MKIPEPLPEENRLTADPETIEKLKDMLLAANNPMIFTRYLGRNPDAVKELVDLAELLKIPIFEMAGCMNYPTDNPFHMGTGTLT